MSLKTDLVRVTGSNLIVLVSSIINGLVLPYVLSFDDFSNLKTYTLYASFIGFLHFGFVDGINIKYGGYDHRNIDKIEFKGFHDFFIIFQFCILFFIILLGLLLHNSIILLVGLAILPRNLQAFFLYFYQAIGEFKDYARAIIIVPILNICITLILVFTGIIDYRVYILSNIFSYLISIIYLEVKYKQYSKLRFFSAFKLNQLFQDRNKYKPIFISGFFIMFGTVLFTLFFDAGRWMTKFFSSNEGFARYSLAVSLIGFVIIFISAINKTFYPFLHKNNNSDLIRKYQSILYVVGSFSLLGFFFLKIIIIYFLPKYLGALPITAILMCSIPGMMIINSIYFNLYKIQKKEKIFLLDTLFYLAIGLSMNVGSYLYFGTLTSIAASSVASIYIWTFFPRSCVKIDRISMLKDFVFIVLILVSFSFVYLIDFNIFLSFIILSSLLVSINFLFFKKQIINLLRL